MHTLQACSCCGPLLSCLNLDYVLSAFLQMLMNVQGTVAVVSRYALTQMALSCVPVEMGSVLPVMGGAVKVC